jgi:6-phosphogluconolactonase
MAEVIRLDDLESLSQEAARRWLAIAQEAVSEQGKFSIALSGGSTPRRLYQIMASSPYKEQTPWAQTHVFWGDERRVAPGDPESDYRMARETLLDHVPVPPDQVHRMLGEGLVSSTVRDYENKLKRYFELGASDWPRFDLVLLGLGADGHTASIFPGTRAVSDLTNMVIVFEIPQLHAERITLTRRVFNNSRNILFLVSGADKAPALAATLEGSALPSKYPAQIIQPTNGELVWLVDKAAAADLKSTPMKGS